MTDVGQLERRTQQRVVQLFRNQLGYATYLAKIVELTKQAKNGPAAAAYPAALNTPALRALHDNLDKNEALALTVDLAVRANRQDDWRNNPFKVKRVRNAIREAVLSGGAPLVTSARAAPAANTARETKALYVTNAESQKVDLLVGDILKLVTNQNEY